MIGLPALRGYGSGAESRGGGAFKAHSMNACPDDGGCCGIPRAGGVDHMGLRSWQAQQAPALGGQHSVPAKAYEHLLHAPFQQSESRPFRVFLPGERHRLHCVGLYGAEPFKCPQKSGRLGGGNRVCIQGDGAVFRDEHQCFRLQVRVQYHGVRPVYPLHKPGQNTPASGIW